jgi:hypothetical protein
MKSDITKTSKPTAKSKLDKSLDRFDPKSLLTEQMEKLYESLKIAGFPK